MKGYQVKRKGGWDTHGLPVEIEVEKQLGIEGKQQIEEYGIAAFNEKCKASVFTYKDMWEQMSKRMGFSCIAEGAEHKEQVDLLRMYGCDKIQGYYYSKPLQMEEYLKRLSSAEA